MIIVIRMTKKLTLKKTKQAKNETAKATYTMDQWGRDHWSVLGYLYYRCVDGINGVGVPDRVNIQCNANRHPGLLVRYLGDVVDGSKSNIRLKHSVLPGPDYDEWDCLDDIEAEGLLSNVGTGINPKYKMTEKGNVAAGALLAHKARGGSLSDFEFDKSLLV